MIAPEKLDELVKFGYDPKRVLGDEKRPGWSVERVERTLHNERRSLDLALRRAAKLAGQIDGGETPRRQPSALERENIAAVEMAAAVTPDEIVDAIRGCAIYLTDDECVRLRGWLVKIFRGER